MQIAIHDAFSTFQSKEKKVSEVVSLLYWELMGQRKEMNLKGTGRMPA